MLRTRLKLYSVKRKVTLVGDGLVFQELSVLSERGTERCSADLTTKATPTSNAFKFKSLFGKGPFTSNLSACQKSQSLYTYQRIILYITCIVTIRDVIHTFAKLSSAPLALAVCLFHCLTSS